MRNKTILMYLLLILVIVISFAIPNLITNIQDKKILSEKYTINKKIHTLSENAKLTGLIETIYSKYNTDKYNIQVSDVVNEVEIITTQSENKETSIRVNGDDILIMFQKLIKRGIIGQDFYKQFSCSLVTYRIWDYDNEDIKYSVNKVFTQDSLDKAIASIEIENGTNKIIAYAVKKEYSKIAKETFVEYAKYLELYSIFDDWEYRDNELSSKTAGIKIVGETDAKYIYVKVVPI